MKLNGKLDNTREAVNRNIVSVEHEGKTLLKSDRRFRNYSRRIRFELVV